MNHMSVLLAYRRAEHLYVRVHTRPMSGLWSQYSYVHDHWGGLPKTGYRASRAWLMVRDPAERQLLEIVTMLKRGIG